LKLEGKVAIVTGAGSGIGEGIAQVLSREKAKVIVADIDLDNANEIVRKIKASGEIGIPIEVDVSKIEDVRNLVKVTIEKFDRIDILVNNAGITKDALLINMTEEEWNLVLDVNLKGTFLCTQAVAKEMIKQKYGRVINISSKGAVVGNPGQANYVASKAGILGFTLTVAKEFAYLASKGANLTCNAIMPGFMSTPMTEKIPEKIRKKFIESIPLGRMGQPEDIGKAVAFLASEEASYVTGAVLAIDGGFYMCL